MKKLIETLCSVLAALALFAIMWLTLVDVSGRKLLSESVPGSLELTELLMVVVIFAGLPLVSLRGEHVVFDSLDTFLPAGLRRAQQAFIDGLCAAALAGVGWLMWTKGSQMLEYGDTTQQLKLTLGWFVHLMSVLICVTALAHLLLIAVAGVAPPPRRRQRRRLMIEALIGFGAIFALALLRVPLAFAMGAVGFVGLGWLRGWPATAASAAQVVYDTGFAYTLSVVPLFILMGNFVARAGLAQRVVPRGLHLHRPCARRPGARHHHCLRRLRCDLRIVHRHRGDDVARWPIRRCGATATPTTCPLASSPPAARWAS